MINVKTLRIRTKLYSNRNRSKEKEN